MGYEHVSHSYMPNDKWNSRGGALEAPPPTRLSKKEANQDRVKTVHSIANFHANSKTIQWVILKNRLFAKIGFANEFANLYLTKFLTISYIGQKDIVMG